MKKLIRMKKVYLKCLSLFIASVILAVPLSSCKEKPTGGNSPLSSGQSAENNGDGGESGESLENKTGDSNTSERSGSGTPGGNTPTNIPGGNSGGSGNNTGDNTTVGADMSTYYFNVKKYGAKGDGKTDDAPAILRAIEAAKKARGGIVYLPGGMYLMKKGITVPMGIVIKGDAPRTNSAWKEVKVQTSSQAAQKAGSSFLSVSNFKGTFIVVDHGKGNVNSAPTFRLQGNAGIDSIGFVYKEQAPITDSVSEFPPAIAMYSTKSYKGTREGVTIDNVYLANAYIGIAIGEITNLKNYDEGATEGVSIGRLRVHNITGGPLWKGIFVKGVLDTVDFSDIHFGFTNFVPSYAAYRHNNCRDLELAREDGAMVNNFTSFGACYGIKSTYSHTGASSLRANNLKIYGKFPLHFTSGMHKVYNAYLEMINYNNYCTDKTFSGISLIPSMQCVHQPFYLFSKVTVKNSLGKSGYTDSSMDVRLGKSANLTMNDCTFDNSSNSNSVPVFNFDAQDRTATSAIFYHATVKGNNSGLLAKINRMGTGAVQFNQSTITDGLYHSVSSVNEVWFLNSKLSSGQVVNKH